LTADIGRELVEI